MMALMDQAMAAGQPQEQASFNRPDVGSLVPEESQDAFSRVVAAGVKIISSPDMREQVQENIERDAPVPLKLSEAAGGLLLTIDQQVEGGIPMDAIFPAGVELLGECADVLVAAGQPVTQEDYNEGARMLFVLVNKKLGASDEEIMAGAEAALQQKQGGQQQEPMPQGEEMPQ